MNVRGGPNQNIGGGGSLRLVAALNLLKLPVFSVIIYFLASNNGRCLMSCEMKPSAKYRPNRGIRYQ